MKTSRIVALATISLLATACGGSSPAATTHVPLTQATVTGATAAPTIPAGTTVVPSGSEAATAFGGAAAAQKGVVAAEHFAEIATGLTQALARGKHDSHTYASVYTLLTPAAVTLVKRTADAGDPQNRVSALVLTSRDSDGSVVVDTAGTRLTLTPPYLTSTSQGEASVATDRSTPTVTRLSVTVPVDTTYTGSEGGKATTVTLHRVLVLGMVPAASGWLVDTWSSTTTPAAK